MPTLADVANLLSIPLPPGADGCRPVAGVNTLADAGPDELSFVSSEQYAKEAAATRAAAVLVHKRVRLPAAPPVPVLTVDDADLAVAKVLQLFAPPVPRPRAGIDPAARVAPSATLGDGCAVGFNVYVGERAALGRNVVLHAGVYVGDDVTIGDDCEFFPNVVVRERVIIGDRVTIHAGSVLGTDGFGYRWDGAKHAKVPQIGTVVVEDDAEIGSCVCIDRAKFGATRIGRGTKIDNLVQVAHNARLGPHCIMAGQSGVAGSVVLGTGVLLGGQCAVRDHVRMGDGSMLAACSGAMEDVPAKAVVSGLPAIPHRQTFREQAALRRLPDIVVQIRKLEERLAALEKDGGTPRTPVK